MVCNNLYEYDKAYGLNFITRCSHVYILKSFISRECDTIVDFIIADFQKRQNNVRKQLTHGSEFIVCRPRLTILFAIRRYIPNLRA